MKTKTESSVTDTTGESPYDRGEFYPLPRENWDAEKCRKMARKHHRDGLGTKCGHAGYDPVYRSGPIRYNGGCIRNGEHYQGDNYTLPALAPGFRWNHLVSWGWQIVEDRS